MPAEPFWIYDFGLRRSAAAGAGAMPASSAVKGLFEDALTALWRGEIEDDGFNALVLDAPADLAPGGGAARLRQVPAAGGHPFSQDYIERVLRSNTTVTRLLVRLFESRFDPARRAGEAERSEAIAEEIRGELDDVASPRSGPDPARLPGPDPGHAADQLLPADAGAAARARACRTWWSSWTRPRCPTCPRRGRSSSCSSTRPGWRRCTCGSPPWPGAGCAGRTGARTSAPRSSAWPRRRR